MALDYLHNRCTPPLVHCDLKPSNVLLDDEMVACLSDFGLAKFLHNNIISLNNSSSTAGLRGSIGYIAPGTDLLHSYLFVSTTSTLSITEVMGNPIP